MPLSPARRVSSSSASCDPARSRRGASERVRRLALTLADLEGSATKLDEGHVAMALELRAGRAALLGGPRVT